MSMNKIKCRLCDDEHNVKQFGMHVSRIHKMKYEDYAKLYWEDLPNWSPCKNEGCNEVCKDSYCSKECMSEGLSRIRKGGKMPPRTKEHSRKISEAAKERLKDPTNHPMYGKTHGDETLEKISQTQKERLKDPTNHPLYGKTHSEETKKLMSEARIDYFKENAPYLKGKKYIEYFGKEKAPEIIKKIFQNKPMNKLEKKVGEYLTELGIDYTFQFFINEDGVCKSYDFKINNTNLILEVHGDYWHGGNGVNTHVFNVDDNIQNDKLKTEIANRRGYEVVVVWESEIKDDIDIIRKRINL